MSGFDPADTPLEVLDKVIRYASEGRTDLLLSDDPVTPGKLRIVGIYDDRQQGYFMLRTRVPGGRLTWQQAETIGLIADEFTSRPPEHAEGPERFLEITTRQNVQYHWVRPSDLPEIWRRYDAVGLLSLSACGDSSRNITACPIAGVDRDELLDVGPLVEELNRFVLENPHYGAGLPRKFKTAITGCRDDCILARINDIAFTPAEREGVTGFNVWVGGGLSDYARLASPLDVFVTREQVIETTCAAIDLFREVGDYENKAVNRFRRVVEEMGVQRVREEIAARVEFDVPPAGSDLTAQPRYDHVGVHPQRQEGRVYVGLAVPVGRVSGADFAEIARVARDFGDGQVRLTLRQNLVLTGIDESRLDEVLALPVLQRLSPNPAPALRSVVACTSAPFCKFGIVDAKSRALDLAGELDGLLDGQPQDAPGGEANGGGASLRVHISGCKASCAHVQVADIGLRATYAKDEASYEEAFDIALGGSLADGRLAGWAALELPAAQAFGGIRRLVGAYGDERQDGERFSAFLARVGRERATSIIREGAE